VKTPERRNPEAPLDMSAKLWPEVACRMERWRGAAAKAKSARIGHKRRSAWPRGAEIDSKKSWAPPETFMGVKPRPRS
jgi:hypothetical protein